MAHSSEPDVPTIVDMSEHELPASIRVALWGTEVLAGRLPADDLPSLALPDLDVSEGLTEGIRLWASLGERVVLAALPRPGDLTGMPRGGSSFVDAAVQAGECVFVPALGGALVPSLEPFGPRGDQGWIARWTAHPADPVPTHRVEALDLGQVELMLRAELAELTEALVGAGPVPFGAAADLGAARARAAQDRSWSWGLPEDLPPRAVRVVELAGTVLALADAGLGGVSGALDATTARDRTLLLQRVQASAGRALTDATNAAAVHRAFR